MNELTYSEKLKDPRWQKKRLEIFQRDEFKCKFCGDAETELQVHHKEYINGRLPWEYDNEKLVTLCCHCHEIVEITKSQIINFDVNSIVSIGFLNKERKIVFIHINDNGTLMACYYQKDRVFFYNFTSKESIKLFQYLSNF